MTVARNMVDEGQRDDGIKERRDTHAPLRRRGILVAAGAITAGILAKQAAEPVAASTPLLVPNTEVGGLVTKVAGQTTIAALPAWTSTGSTILRADASGAGGADVDGIQGVGKGTFSGLSGVGGNSGGNGVFGQGGGAVGTGVSGIAGAAGLGGFFQGGLAPLRLAASATAGAPTILNHSAGELYVDSAGSLFYCKVSGTPGTWARLDTTPASVPVFTTLPTPERLVDTRNNLGGLQGPVPANTTHTFQMTGRNGGSGNPALQIPDTATTIVGNVTVVGAAGIPLGSFLTIWPGGTQPTVSNINYGPAATSGAIANTFVVGLTTAGGHGNLNVFNLSACDYILDVTGYYTNVASASAASVKK